MNLSQLILSYDNKSGGSNEHATVIAAKAIMKVIQHDISLYGTFFTITLCCRRKASCTFYNNLMEKLFHLWGLTVVNFVALAENSTVRVPGSRHYNLIFVDSFAAFRTIDIAYYTKENNYNEYYYILLHIRDDLFPNELQQILEYCWANSLINCSVQSQDKQGEITVYSYFPLGPDCCGCVKPVLINSYNNTGFVKPEFFPQKLDNFHGCAVKVALWHLPPFVHLDTDDQGVSRIAGGMEGCLLLLMADRLNFTIDITVPLGDEKEKGSVFSQTLAGLKMIKSRQVGIILGGLIQSLIFLDYTSSVSSYYHSREVMAVAEDAYHLTSLEKVVTPFEWLSWLCILSACIICWFLGCQFSRYYREHVDEMQPLLNYLAVLLGMSATHMPSRSHSRLLFTAWMIFTMLIRTVYQGVLFTYIQANITTRMPTALDELAAKNFTTVMTSINRAFLSDVELLNSFPSIILPSTDGGYVFDYITKYRRRNLVAVAPLGFLKLYQMSHKNFGNLKVLPIDLMNLEITMMMPKHSYLIDKFEAEIWWMRSAGLLRKFSLTEYSKVQLKEKKHAKEVDKGLHVKDVFAIFAILGVGLCASLVAFTLELLSLRIQFLRKLLLKIN